jgi:hypothetical protein
VGPSVLSDFVEGKMLGVSREPYGIHVSDNLRQTQQHLEFCRLAQFDLTRQPQGPSCDIARAKISPVDGFVRFNVSKTLPQRFTQNPNFRHFSNLRDAKPVGSRYTKSHLYKT